MEVDKDILNKLMEALENHHNAIDAILVKLDMKGKIKNLGDGQVEVENEG